jgi:hypothetical protein
MQVRAADEVGGHLRAFRELHQHDGVRHLGGKPGVIDLMHHVEAEDLAAPRDRLPLALRRQAGGADLARRKPIGAAVEAALDDELAAFRGCEERPHLGSDGGDRFGHGQGSRDQGIER